MQRVERHIVIRDSNFDDLCFRSKNLYNQALYRIKQHWTETGKMLSEYDLSMQLASEDQVDYRSLPAQTSQQVIKLLYKSWKLFFSKRKKDSLCKPPKYKHKTKGRNVVVFTNQQVKLKDGFVHFPKFIGLNPFKTMVDNINQVRIVPQQSCFVVEIVYTKQPVSQPDLNPDSWLSVDMGVDVLCACVTNSALQQPLLINGKIIKSINQFFNKQLSRLKSLNNNKTSRRIQRLSLKRSNIIHNYLHHTSRFIIDYCVENKIKNIVIGYNQGWKQEINIGAKSNQKFVSIPHHKLIQQIRYKAEEIGIEVSVQEESYTSRCDALGLEAIQKHITYKGKRVKRGLFQSSFGCLVHADINGATNILRKVLGNSFVITNRDHGQWSGSSRSVNPLLPNVSSVGYTDI